MDFSDERRKWDIHFSLSTYTSIEKKKKEERILSFKWSVQITNVS